MKTDKTEEKNRGWLLKTVITVVLMLCFTQSVFATTPRDPADIQCGADVYANLGLDGTLTIYGTGEMNNSAGKGNDGPGSYRSGNGPFIGIAEQISSVVVENGVTSIGDYAFCSGMGSFSGLTSVTISDSVTSIGEGAFAGCSALQAVGLGSSVRSIGKWAFQYCSKLNTINFPSALQVIGDAAFYDCTVLGSKMLALPETLVQIGASAFYRCSITSITIPVSVKNIGEAAFSENKLSAMIPRKDAMFIGKIAFDNDSTVYGYPGTYVEQWCEANKYIVTFVPIKTQITLDGNGGTIHGGLTYGIEEVCGTFFANLPDGTAMARAGYIFAGWFTERDGGVAVTDNSTVATTDPFTLYAHWEVDTTPEKEKVTPSTTPSRITVKPALNKVQPLNKARIKVTWKKKRVKGANAIEIQYSTNKKFKGKAVYKKKVKLNQTNITLAKLKKKTTYYIRIRYVGTKTVSPWSNKIKVKTLKK